MVDQYFFFLCLYAFTYRNARTNLSPMYTVTVNYRYLRERTKYEKKKKNQNSLQM